MNTLLRCSLSVCVVLFIAPLAGAQGESVIGSFLAPWFDPAGFSGETLAMTPDGSLIAFVEGQGNCNLDSAIQRISIIRPDGTGYRIVVDTPVLDRLQPSSFTVIRILRFAGDGKTLAFMRHHKIQNCNIIGGPRWYLVDVESGRVDEFTFNNNAVGFLTFTDDGQTMAFKGYDPARQAWGYYTANEDGSDPELVLDTTPFGSSASQISGDGSKLLFIDIQPVFPIPSNIYLLDIATGALTKLNPQSLNNISSGSLSTDGSRVVFGPSIGPTFTVDGNGANLQQILPGEALVATTVTRDGQWIFFTAWFSGTPGPFTYRMSWDGSIMGPATNPFYGGGGRLSQQPVNADGSLHVSWTPFPFGSLAVTFFTPPILTTYGYGHPGEPLTWDVGGLPGDSYILAMSLGLAAPGLPTQFGLLELDPARLTILASGTVGGPKNIGSFAVTIPTTLLSLPLFVYSQALVQSPGGGGTLTNLTAVRLHDGPAAQDSASTAGWPVGVAGAQPPWPPANLTPQQRLQQLIQLDPELSTQWRRER